MLCFRFVFCHRVYPILPVSLDLSCLIDPSLFSNDYLVISIFDARFVLLFLGAGTCINGGYLTTEKHAQSANERAISQYIWGGGGASQQCH